MSGSKAPDRSSSGHATAHESPPRTLPTGTVTFLFTDIEGSTALLDRVGTDRYEAALARHRELIRAALRATGGVEIVTEGDSFFVVFEAAGEALAAAVDAQRRLQAEAWPAGDEIRVRMGLHTGVGALDRDGSYVGRGRPPGRPGRSYRERRPGRALGQHPRPHRDEPLPGVRVRALGEHRLKDLQPEPLFDLAIDGLATTFGALRGASSRIDTLPSQLTTFIGRESEVAGIVALLGEARLVTLTGPGGIGKTRLAIAAATAMKRRRPRTASPSSPSSRSRTSGSSRRRSPGR